MTTYKGKHYRKSPVYWPFSISPIRLLRIRFVNLFLLGQGGRPPVLREKRLCSYAYIIPKGYMTCPQQTDPGPALGTTQGDKYIYCKRHTDPWSALMTTQRKRHMTVHSTLILDQPQGQDINHLCHWQIGRILTRIAWLNSYQGILDISIYIYLLE